MAPRQSARRLLAVAPAVAAAALVLTACYPPNEQPADPDHEYTLPTYTEPAGSDADEGNDDGADVASDPAENGAENGADDAAGNGPGNGTGAGDAAGSGAGGDNSAMQGGAQAEGAVAEVPTAN